MLASRTQLEALEKQALAPYAQASCDSRGRAYPEAEHGYRTLFQRDRDRILHTTAFRRLEYKTQVFVNSEGDHYRTRLTHTLEVAQIARTMARALMLNQDLTEAIALAHDLGHTPFGHAGESVLHELMRDRGGFNHNTHGLRIVEKLEERYPGFPGLNLTWELREGIVKHATEYDTPEAGEYEPSLRCTLEGQLINLADEVAYTTHDLDDGLRSGLISASQLQGISLWDETLAVLRLKATELTSLDRNRVIRHLVNLQVTDVIQTTATRLDALHLASVNDVRAQPDDMVCFSAEMQAQIREFHDFLFENLYRHWRVMRMTAKARRMLQRLFETFVSEPQQLPEAVQRRAVREGLERAVCDYIAGMTDRYALQEYRKLFDPDECVCS